VSQSRLQAGQGKEHGAGRGLPFQLLPVTFAKRGPWVAVLLRKRSVELPSRGAIRASPNLADSGYRDLVACESGWRMQHSLACDCSTPKTRCTLIQSPLCGTAPDATVFSSLRRRPRAEPDGGSERVWRPLPSLCSSMGEIALPEAFSGCRHRTSVAPWWEDRSPQHGAIVRAWARGHLLGARSSTH